MKQPVASAAKAFTIRYNAPVNKLFLQVGIIDPIKTRLAGVEATEELTARKNAIFDTGATSCCIGKAVAKELGLAPTGMTTVTGVGGSFPTNVYLLDIEMPHKVVHENIMVTEVEDIIGVQMLIGMDIIGLGDLSITHEEGKTVVSHVLPPLKCIDYVQEIEDKKHKPAVSGKIQPNLPCPCGSGRKYKKCCGAGK